MTDQLTNLEEAMRRLRHAWAGRDAATPASALDRPRLVAVTEALGALGRRLDAVRAQVAAEIDRQSRPELGAHSLAKQQGFRNGTALVAATTGMSTGDAARLAAVGKAVAPRLSLGGEPLPPPHTHVAAAVDAGTITAAGAALIVGMLDRVALRASAERRDEAERLLATQAAGLTLEALRKVVVRAEAWLDPDGVEPAERDRHGRRALRLFERDGMLHIDGQVDAVTGAPLKVAIEALVTDTMRHTRDDVTAGDDDAVRPTVAQLQADALIQLASHALSCDTGDLPLDDTTVVIRMSLDMLRDGEGSAEIDGITQPPSPAAARRAASGAGVVPCVLGGPSEILDWGRRRRLFTRAQRMALVERDGGCAMCNLPPGMTRAHHLHWWARDGGRTDLADGVLLCDSCHHRIHDNGWQVRIESTGPGGKVWFIPPATVDPQRTPRLGGRARFDYAAAA